MATQLPRNIKSGTVSIRASILLEGADKPVEYAIDLALDKNSDATFTYNPIFEDTTKLGAIAKTEKPSGYLDFTLELRSVKDTGS